MTLSGNCIVKNSSLLSYFLAISFNTEVHWEFGEFCLSILLFFLAIGLVSSTPLGGCSFALVWLL